MQNHALELWEVLFEKGRRFDEAEKLLPELRATEQKQLQNLIETKKIRIPHVSKMPVMVAVTAS